MTKNNSVILIFLLIKKKKNINNIFKFYIINRKLKLSLFIILCRETHPRMAILTRPCGINPGKFDLHP
jgi:hypothetical protein